MNRNLPVTRRWAALLATIITVLTAVAIPAPAEPPALADGGASPESPGVSSPAPLQSYRLKVLDRSTDAPVARCRIYREGPGNERQAVGETDLSGRLELPEAGQKGQRLLALSLSYDPVITDCPIQGETVLRARLTRYASQNEEKAEIAASAGDFATAADLSLQAARLAQREEQQSIGRDPASATPAPGATPGQRQARAFRRILPNAEPPAPRATPGVSRAVQRYESQAYEYAARSLRLEGPATVRHPDTGAVEPSPEMKRRLEILQRRQNLPATGRLEAGVPSRLPRPE